MDLICPSRHVKTAHLKTLHDVVSRDIDNTFCLQTQQQDLAS